MTTCLPSPQTLCSKKRVETAAYIQRNPLGQIEKIEIKPFEKLEGRPLLSVRKPSAQHGDPMVIRNWERVRQAVCLLPWIEAAQNRTSETHSHNAALIFSHPAGEVAHVEVFGTLPQAIANARTQKTTLNLDIIAHWGLCVQAVLWLRNA